MSRISRTSRTTDLGLRIIAGQERRDLLDQIAFQRAEFELIYEGRKIAAFDDESIFKDAARITGETYISITEDFCREARERLPRAKRIVLEHDGEHIAAERKRLDEAGL